MDMEKEKKSISSRKEVVDRERLLHFHAFLNPLFEDQFIYEALS